jgi:glycosyltransferase involved in cell wall biosynthesis
MAKRVLFFHHGNIVGGAPLSMIELASGLDRDRYSPSVVFSQGGPLVQMSEEAGVPTVVAPLSSALFYGAQTGLRVRNLLLFTLHYRRTVREARAIIRELRPDVVHLNTSVLLPVGAAAKKEGVPIVWHVREVPGNNPRLRRWLTGTIARSADRVIAISEHIATAYPPSSRLRVVHNAVDLKRFEIDVSAARTALREELGIPRDVAVVAVIGSITRAKGHDVLIGAARRMSEQLPDVRFIVVGPQIGAVYARSWKGRIKRFLRIPLDESERIRRLAHSNGLANRFVYTGYRPDIPEILAASDALAFLPLYPEGFGRPLIEAMAVGRPVVATDIGPSREIVGADTASLIPAGDVSATANALVTLLTDSQRRAKMGEAGKARVRHLFSSVRMIEAVSGIYDEVLGEGAAYSTGEPGAHHGVHAP